MPISGERQVSRGLRLGQRYGRAVMALALAFLASSAIAPGVETIFAQSTPRYLAQADPAANHDEASALSAYATSGVAGEVTDAPVSPAAQSTLAPTHGAAAADRDTELGAAVTQTITLASGADRDLRSGAQVPPQLAAATTRENALAFLAQLDAADLQPRARDTSQPADAAPAWQDQYLFNDGELAPLDQNDMFAAQPFGVETLAVDLTSYTSQDDFFGEDTERGARVYWSRETENWGTFDLDLQVADVNSTFIGRQTDGSEAVVTLRQSLMPVSATTLLSTTAGHQRTATSSLLHGGYRYRMPSSIILGLNGELVGIDGTARITVGDIGAYRGMRMARFDATGGQLTSVGYERTLSDRLEIGAELAGVRGDDDIRNHTSALVAGRYTLPDDSQEHAIRLLADDDSRFGFWTNSRLSFDYLPTLRFGMSYLEPDLVWADLPIPNDQLSAYVRADKGNSTYDLSAGYDYLELGVNSGALAGTKTHSAFFSGQWRLRRAFSIGATASLSYRAIDAALNEEKQDLQRLNLYASLRSPIGATRFEVFSHTLDSPVETNRRERQGAAASLSWRLPERVQLTTELRSERVDSQRGDTERTELSALFRYSLFDDVSLGLTSAIYETRGAEFAEDNGLMLSADARWSINRDWRATLSVNRNRADFDVDSIDSLGMRDNAGTTSVWLTVSYQHRRGQPYPTFGRTQDGMSGSGTVSGEIFFDENRDTIRQPSERAAAGVVVVLDGRYETRTDVQGRYTFAPVPTGAHQLVVVSSDLPLPWGLDNEAPRRIVVRFRENAGVNFPLVQLN